MKAFYHRAFAVLLALAFSLSLAACGRDDGDPVAQTPADVSAADAMVVSVSDTMPEGPLPNEGTEFIYSVFIEGMDEVVHGTYITCPELGVAVAYDREFFVFSRGEDEQGQFLTVYSKFDPSEHVVNYISFRPMSGSLAECTAQIYSAACADFTETATDTVNIAGRSCYACYASAGYSESADGDACAEYYAIPTDGGCIVAQMHYTYESAEGFGARMRAMLDTLAVA